MLSRTKELKYNTKADIYRKAERNIRRIYETAVQNNPDDDKDLRPLIKPLDVEVVTVKPKWLCGTFGFHPMLGFRREKQARNIAHGCAATLLRFASVETNFLQGWNIDNRLLPKSKTFEKAHEAAKSGKIVKSDCWLRPGIPCPYAKENLNRLNRDLRRAGSDSKGLLDEHAIKELSKIRIYCSDRKTHRPD